MTLERIRSLAPPNEARVLVKQPFDMLRCAVSDSVSRHWIPRLP